MPYGHALHLLHVRSRLFGAAVVRGIFLAVDRCDMWRVPAEIWASDSKLLSMRINPVPELFGGSPSLVASSALDTHDIGRKPMPIAPAGAPAMIRPVARRLEGACARLAGVFTEAPGNSGERARRLRRVKRMKQF